MQHREWQDQQTGEKRTAFEVVRVEVHFLDKKPDDVQSGNPAQPTAAPTAGYAAPQGAAPVAPGYMAPTTQPAMQQAAPAAPAAPATVMQAQSAAGYPQPVPGAAAQFTVPDFSGVPENYAWGPGGMPTGNTPF